MLSFTLLSYHGIRLSSFVSASIHGNCYGHCCSIGSHAIEAQVTLVLLLFWLVPFWFGLCCCSMAIAAASVRGGRRQRSAAQQALVAGDVPVDDSSALADALIELWAYGLMSATMVQGLASKAVQDG